MLNKIINKSLLMLNSKKYPNIEDHGIIFNNRTAALITDYGTVDWACFPNFDSDPVFFSILDSKCGGYFKIFTDIENIYTRQYYENDNPILNTFFYRKNEKLLKILDFMPTSQFPAIYFSEIHRFIQSYMDFNLNIEFSAFDRSKKISILEKKGYGYLMKQNGRNITISTNIVLRNDANVLYGTKEIKEGESFWIVVSYGLEKIYSVNNFKSDERLAEARNYWKKWISKSKYNGKYYEIINRSLITLKGLFFEPNSFMVASPTTSLPESIGGDRNWDYRFTWIRDTAYVIDIFSRLGYLDEATNFLVRIIDRIERDGVLNSIYSISGKKDIREIEREWEGYKKSRPVRIGNDASTQFQLDQYGSLINAIYELVINGGTINLHIWEKMKDIIHMILNKWEKPDNSIWEFRTEPKHYVYSKVLAWRAIKDMIELGKIYGLDETEYFNSLAETMKKIEESIYKNGISKDNYFIQYYGSDYVDVALMRLPLLGFCSIEDQIYLNTLKQIEEKLMVEDFLFKRYDSNDNLKSNDNAFLLASFWYIENLLLLNDVEKASRGLIKILKSLNNLNLLPEEIEFKSHRYLGNYPQALSHLGIISATLKLEERLKN